MVAASSQGIGKAISFSLAKEGADVTLSGRHEYSLKEKVKEFSPLVKGQLTFKYVMCLMRKPRSFWIRLLVSKIVFTFL
ncbi:hypothetical protein [Bacillus sp. FJAT-53060]|uniref:hypothetical protein n=1 Tax=Bacillus sp. FJAT-53060 TaxID=3127666 RepID=UPI003FA57004